MQRWKIKDLELRKQGLKKEKSLRKELGKIIRKASQWKEAWKKREQKKQNWRQNTVMNEIKEVAAMEEANKFSREIITLTVTQFKIKEVNNVDRGHGQECKNESESIADSN